MYQGGGRQEEKRVKGIPHRQVRGCARTIKTKDISEAEQIGVDGAKCIREMSER